MKRPLAAILLAVCALFMISRSVLGETRPNFLFVYTDDQRWDAMSVVQREHGERARFPWIQTPNMDRLAAEGVRFRNAFVVNSLCAPSRASFLTGCYGYLNGVVNNHTEFPVTNVTYATLLQKAGYVTGYIGKWHMGKQSGQRPGFSYSASFVGQGKYVDCPFEINGKSTETKGWVDDVSADFALNFIRENKDKPFLLAVGLKSPHGPRTPPQRLATFYANEQAHTVPNLSIPAIYLNAPDYATAQPTPPGLVAKTDLDYHRCIHAADEELGKLLDELDKLGLADNTFVIFTSDNGYYLGEHRLGDKRSAYEESMRVPMLVRYPKLGVKGKLVDTAAINIDIAPTIVDYAGIPVPPQIQGRSWRPLLEGNPTDWRRAFFYCFYYETKFRTPTMMAVRNESAKLVKYPGHDEWTELFDVKADPYEIKNLVHDSGYSDLRQQMEAEYSKESAAIGFEIPVFADNPKKDDPVPPATQACVLDYQFEKDAGDKIVDASGNSNNATAHGLQLVDGHDGHKALQFDGQTSIDVGKSKSLSPITPGWTVEITFQSQKPDGILLAHGGASNGYCLYLKDGKPAWAVRAGRSLSTVRSSEPLSEGWHTLAAKFTADHQMMLVLDGKQIASGKLRDFISKDPNKGLQIGANRGSPVSTDEHLPQFTGRVESVRIFNYATP